MEPMALGSPSSPAASPAGSYLPSFLMGDTAPMTPRNSTLSPNKCGRSLTFGNSPCNTNSPQDYNRSVLGQKTLFGYQQTPPTQAPLTNHSSNLTGPPTQGLFENLMDEPKPKLHQTPLRNLNMQSPYGEPTAQSLNSTGNFALEHSLGLNQPFATHSIPQYADSQYYGSANASHVSQLMSPTCMGSTGAGASAAAAAAISPCTPLQFRNNMALRNNSYLNSTLGSGYTRQNDEFWVTVFGFPDSATNMVLQHFSQCGTILDKVFPPQNGNWVHLKYSSRLECDKALNFNEKVLTNNIMIGVMQCRDSSIVDKENNYQENRTLPRIRPLTLNDNSVEVNPNTPKKNGGIMEKAMDLIFGR